MAPPQPSHARSKDTNGSHDAKEKIRSNCFRSASPPKLASDQPQRHRAVDWEAIGQDRRRQKYLGNSVKAPPRGRDPFWYSRTSSQSHGSRTSVQTTSPTGPGQQFKLERDAQRAQEARLMEFYLKRGFGARAPDELVFGSDAPCMAKRHAEQGGSTARARREMKCPDSYPLEFDDIGRHA